MKEAIVSPGPKVTIQDSPIPKPGPRQVLTKIVYSGCNPKDWKVYDLVPNAPPMNQGDDISGIVHEVGEEVTEFKKGDRVAAFHEMMTPGGSYAEYGLSWDHTTFHLPKTTSFQEGAAIPLAALTAVMALFAHDRLGLPQVISPASSPIPLVIYGASSAVGSYALQLALRANIHPLICVAGRAQAHAEKFVDRSKGDTVIDYRQGDAAVVEGIQQALKGQKLWHAFDAVTDKTSCVNICKVLEPTGKLTLVLPGPQADAVPKTFQVAQAAVSSCHSDQKDLAFAYSRLFTRGLQEGWFRAQPQEVVPGGLAGVQSALDRLKDGSTSATKYVFEIGGKTEEGVTG